MMKIQRFFGGSDNNQTKATGRKVQDNVAPTTAEDDEKKSKSKGRRMSTKRYTVTRPVDEKAETSRNGDGKTPPNGRIENTVRFEETYKRSAHRKRTPRSRRRTDRDMTTEGFGKEIRELYRTEQMQPTSDTDLDDLYRTPLVSGAFSSTRRSEKTLRRTLDSNVIRCFCEYCMDVVAKRPMHCKFYLHTLRPSSRMGSLDRSLTRSRRFPGTRFNRQDSDLA
ncbi:hypothetical protein WDU94_007031 [Cyamophila willieti]